MDNLVKTIYGYEIIELVLFAKACRDNGVTENELHDFVLNYQYAFKLGLASANSILFETINDIFKGEN